MNLIWKGLVFVRCNMIVGHSYMENKDKTKSGFSYKCLYCGHLTNFKLGG